jgi:hypothetical protein
LVTRLAIACEDLPGETQGRAPRRAERRPLLQALAVADDPLLDAVERAAQFENDHGELVAYIADDGPNRIGGWWASGARRFGKGGFARAAQSVQ